MLEVRSTYIVAAKDIRDAIDLWREGRDRIWPELDWSGRIQQMLHGHAQQTAFVWSSEWPSLAAWEGGMQRTLDSAAYKAWSADMNRLRRYGEEREVFTAFGDVTPLDLRPGAIEVRSAYLARIADVGKVKELMQRAQREVWPDLGWGGQNQQMLHGKAAQSMFVWTSTWTNLASWETAMGRTVDHAGFQPWYREFLAAIDVGGPREIFRNL